MLPDYINAIMRHATYELLDDGAYYGHIATANLAGLWANEQTLEACRNELKSVIEDWLIFALECHRTIPVIVLPHE
ncbi:MAG: type II toxin-antitoxin system HicB family antitoxin [Chloroflexota bacterium]|nr:type II toxin-antitoxin system HicB family antitoxin [Chloroflexota bacterium]